jgi:hypothetical protein
MFLVRDTEGLGNRTRSRYCGWGCREWNCDWRLREAWREYGEARDGRDEVVLYSYFKVVYEDFDDVLRDRHCEHELGMSFLHGVCMTVSWGKCGKVGGAEVCLSMFDLYEYRNYLELDLGSPNLDLDL